MSDIDIPPEAFAAAIEMTARRRKTAIEHALMLVANNKLQAWAAFDYAFALDRYLATGLPPRDILKPAARRKRTVH